MALEGTRRGRRSIRLPGHDYGEPGAYFVTICTKDRSYVLGTIREGEVVLSRVGEEAAACWAAIPEHFPHVSLDAFIVVPNHVHGIVVIAGRGTPWRAPTEAFGRPVPGSLATVIRAFKSSVTRLLIRDKRRRGSLWQRGYYEHVVREEDELGRLRPYIAENPLKWDEDAENPARRSG